MGFVKKTESINAADQRQSARDEAGLVSQLQSVDASVRRWAARDLLEFPGATSALVSHLRQETDSSVREVILTTLARLGNSTAVQGLVECLRSEDAGLRNEAIEALKSLPAEVAPIMESLLADVNPDVRIFPVNVLESLRHPKVESWLIAVVTSDQQVNVCATAVDLLGEVGTALSVPALMGLQQRFPGEPYIEFATNLALRRIGKV